jgi:hypothetical protein
MSVMRDLDSFVCVREFVSAGVSASNCVVRVRAWYLWFRARCASAKYFCEMCVCDYCEWRLCVVHMCVASV